MLNVFKTTFFLALGFIFPIYFCYGGLPSETTYLTWKSNPDTTMVVQWISEKSQENGLVLFRKVIDNKNSWSEVNGSFEAFSNMPQLLLHQTEIKNLQPNTLYEFRLAVEDFQTPRYFLTMPNELTNPIRFVVGGDMYHDNHGTDSMKKTCRQSANTNPHFALIGGDIAYAFSHSFSKEKPDRWIDWLKAWSSTMTTKDNRVIPVIAAVGNHDVEGHYNQTPNQAKTFRSLFPTTGRQTYGVIDFGRYLSLFLLDSGHACSIQSQSKWLEDALKMRQETYYKFAIYHVPAYPSVRSLKNSQSVAIRRHWVPIFEKWGIEMAFEHHDHAYKRTYPLIQGKQNPHGIIYVGDGAWSVDKTRQPSLSNKNNPYLAKFASVRHFILMTLKQEEKQIQTISDSGQIVDELTIENTILETATAN